MRNFDRDLIMDVCERPGLYVQPANLDTVVAFILGLDARNDCMLGFHQWLVVNHGMRDNMCWEGFIKKLVLSTCDEDSQHLSNLHGLLRDFTEYCTPTDGRRNTGILRVFADYHHFLLSQSWYTADLPEYVPPPGKTTGQG